MDRIICYMDPTVPEDSDCHFCCCYCKEKDKCYYTCPIVRECPTEEEVLKNSTCEFLI